MGSRPVSQLVRTTSVRTLRPGLPPGCAAGAAMRQAAADREASADDRRVRAGRGGGRGSYPALARCPAGVADDRQRRLGRRGGPHRQCRTGQGSLRPRLRGAMATSCEGGPDTATAVPEAVRNTNIPAGPSGELEARGVVEAGERQGLVAVAGSETDSTRSDPGEIMDRCRRPNQQPAGFRTVRFSGAWARFPHPTSSRLPVMHSLPAWTVLPYRSWRRAHARRRATTSPISFPRHSTNWASPSTQWAVLRDRKPPHEHLPPGCWPTS